MNTLHAATRLMCDKELVQNVRMIGYLCRPSWSAFTSSVDLLKSAASSARLYADWTHGSWLAEMKETIGLLRDLRGMAPGGLHVDFSEGVVSGLDPGSPKVLYQDSVADDFWKLAVNLVGTRLT